MMKMVESNQQKVLRVASLILINAMLFQEVLSQKQKKVETLNHTLSQTDIISEFDKQWRFIEKAIDYIPIFSIARRIILTLSVNKVTDDAVRELANTAILISRNRAALRHDLMGRIFHTLLKDPKFLGTYYTKISAAAMLLQLSIRNDVWNNIDWTDPEKISKIKIIDLAAGTGTLLKAALAASEDRYIESCVKDAVCPNPTDLHTNLIENSIYGFDVFTSAIHIAASAIAMHDPQATINKINLYALPLGGTSNRLGSIEFANKKSSTVHRQTTLLGGIIGGGKGTKKSETTDVTLPYPDLCVMNPPFTRDTSNSGIFGDFKFKQKAELKKKLSQIVKGTKSRKKRLDRKGLDANITAGLGSVFVAIADKYLKENCILSLVLPKTVLNGTAWEKTRKIFKKYDIQFVIKSHEPKNYNFSESTKLSEVLLVLKKGRSKENKIKFINLWKQPKNNIEAVALITQVLDPKTIPAYLDSDTGVCSILQADEKFGEVSTLPQNELEKIMWSIPTAFAQTDLCRIAYHLSLNEIFIPTKGVVTKFKTVLLNSCITMGPDVREIYDAFKTPDEGVDYSTPYPAYWGIDSKTSKQIQQSPNGYLEALTSPKKGRKLGNANDRWNDAGTILLPHRYRINTNSIFAICVDSKVLANGCCWPCKWISKNDETSKQMEKRLALWLNSTLGLISVFMTKSETEGALVSFSKKNYEKFHVLDLNSLSPKNLKILDKLWNSVSSKNIGVYSKMKDDKIRKEIDDVFCKIFKINSLDDVRLILSREPIITQKIIS